MQDNTLKNTMLLFRLCLGLSSADNEAAALDKDAVKGAYKLAKHHDLAHLVASAVKKYSLPCDDELAQKLDKYHLIALFRCKHQMNDLAIASHALEEAKITHVPLKGSVLRSYYPSEWMRIGCDIDVLVKESDLAAAVACLTEKCSYTLGAKGPHDITLISPAGTHLELHYDLIEKEEHGEDRVLESFMEHATPRVGSEYCCEVSDEMFYYYHIAHMAKHFIHGGCGMRSILDVWVLNNRKSFDPEKRKALLAKGRYLKFAEAAEKLADVWFSGAPATHDTENLESYIVGAGVYGSSSSRAALNTVKQGSRIKYILSRAFLPYEQLKFQYPSLDGKKWLTPIYQIRRMLRVIFGGEFKRSMTEINTSVNISKEKSAALRELLEQVGLK